MAKIRLQRFLSQAGVAARRKAEQLIVDGVVKVNGKVVDVLGAKVDPERDRVSVAGKAVHPEDLFYVVLNKPKGCITSVSDPEGRRTVMEYVRAVPVSIVPVGRLDYYSEGVLLLTNDGELSAALQSPKNHIPKTYHVKIRGQVRDKHIEAMRKGVRLEDGRRTRPAQVEPLRGKSTHDWLAITLTEGRSRQIRRMAEVLGYQVLKLQRVAFADITFHGLRLGDARELTQTEVNDLRKAVNLPTGGRAISRGKWKVKREDTEYSRRAQERSRQGLSGREMRKARKVARAAAPKPEGGRRGVGRTASRPPAKPTSPRGAAKSGGKVGGRANATPSRETDAAPSRKTGGRADAKPGRRSGGRVDAKPGRKPARPRSEAKPGRTPRSEAKPGRKPARKTAAKGGKGRAAATPGKPARKAPAKGAGGRGAPKGRKTARKSPPKGRSTRPKRTRR